MPLLPSISTLYGQSAWQRMTNVTFFPEASDAGDVPRHAKRRQTGHMEPEGRCGAGCSCSLDEHKDDHSPLSLGQLLFELHEVLFVYP